jgi:hypothetical protein
VAFRAPSVFILFIEIVERWKGLGVERLRGLGVEGFRGLGG